VITSETWRGKRYAVLGLARSGLATVRALLASGAEVVAWDANADARAALKAPPLQGRGWGGDGSVERQLQNVLTVPTPNPSPEGEGLTSLHAANARLAYLMLASLGVSA
jgi:UDP-N-acetylmuramoylalanine--D-glutamate ligase